MPESGDPRCAVFAVGNGLMTDDGIGEAVLTALDRAPHPNVRLVNAGSDPLRVLQELDDCDRALVVDAAEMDLEPGAVRMFEADDTNVNVRLCGDTSHGIDLAAVVVMARKLGLSHKIRFMAVQAASFDAGPGLSPEIEAALPAIMESARQALADLQMRFNP